MIKLKDDEVPGKRAGRGAYYEVGVLLHEVLRMILPPKVELEGENEATNEVVDQVLDYGEQFALDEPLAKIKFKEGQLKDLVGAMEMVLKTDPFRKAKPKRIPL